jgi:hypothetical protein
MTDRAMPVPRCSQPSTAAPEPHCGESPLGPLSPASSHGCVTPQPNGDCGPRASELARAGRERTPSKGEATASATRGQHRPQSVAPCLRQPEQRAPRRCLQPGPGLDPVRLRSRKGRRLRHGCGRPDEREGEAISNRHSRHQGIQHRSINVGCFDVLRALSAPRERHGPPIGGSVLIATRANGCLHADRVMVDAGRSTPHRSGLSRERGEHPVHRDEHACQGTVGSNRLGAG